MTKSIENFDNNLSPHNDPSETEICKLVGGALEAKRVGDEKKEMSFWMEASKLNLKEDFDIEDLTTIESVSLRRITEEVMKEQLAQEIKRDKLLKEEDKHGAHLANFSTYDDLNNEIVWRWLWELYGIARQEIPGNIIDNAFKEYLRRTRERAHKI